MKTIKTDIEVYEYIKRFVLENNVTPSMREIAEDLGFKSLSSVHGHLKKLIDAGLIIPYGENTIRYFVKGLKVVEDERHIG